MYTTNTRWNELILQSFVPHSARCKQVRP